MKNSRLKVFGASILMSTLFFHTEAQQFSVESVAVKVGDENKTIVNIYFDSQGLSVVNTAISITPAENFTIQNPTIDETIYSSASLSRVNINSVGKLSCTITGAKDFSTEKHLYCTFELVASEGATSSSFLVSGCAYRKTGDSKNLALEAPKFNVSVLNDITLDSKGYASYSVCAPVSVIGATVKGGTVNGDVLSLTGDGNTVPANTGVMLVGDPGATVSFTAAESADAISSALTPAVLDTEVAESSVIVYAKNAGEFRTFSGTVIPANKAYLQDAPAGIRIRIDDVNGINSINADKNVAFRYNLMGVQTSNEKGITIENGKKVLK